MKVTILITNYNYARFLRRCIRSCLNQSMPKFDYEIIIVDDASNDDSHLVLKDFEDESNIRIFYNKTNMGLGASCRLGSSKALGQCIVRVDADDYVHEDFARFLYLYLSTNKVPAVSCDYIEVDANEEVLARKSARDEPIACGVMFKTDILHEIGSYKDLRIHEEKELLGRFSDKYEMSYLDVPLYRYYIHDDSLSRGGE